MSYFDEARGLAFWTSGLYIFNMYVQLTAQTREDIFP